MNDIHGIHLKRLHTQLGDVVQEMTKVQFSRFSRTQSWSPALNLYRCENCLVICADLAGVDGAAIDLEVEPRRLLLRGRREAPEPGEGSHKPVQVLAMEIDYGEFVREVRFPVDVEVRRVSAEQKNGLLWIYVPLRPTA